MKDFSPVPPIHGKTKKVAWTSRFPRHPGKEDCYIVGTLKGSGLFVSGGFENRKLSTWRDLHGWAFLALPGGGRGGYIY
jgi:hypothetical protein